VLKFRALARNIQITGCRFWKVTIDNVGITKDAMTNDPTQDLPNERDRTTQPSITALFELVREVKQSVDAINARLDAINARLDATNARLDATNARLDATNARLDEMEAGHARDFAALDARLVELSEDVRSGFMRLEDKIDQIYDARRRGLSRSPQADARSGIQGFVTRLQ
jgi:methyl-accepting chemotaxis protein